MTSQLVNLEDSSDDEMPAMSHKNVMDDFDPFGSSKQSDLLLEIQSEIQNGSTFGHDDDSIHLDYTVNTSSDLNSLIQQNDVTSDSQLYSSEGMDDIGVATDGDARTNGHRMDSGDEEEVGEVEKNASSDVDDLVHVNTGVPLWDDDDQGHIPAAHSQSPDHGSVHSESDDQSNDGPDVEPIDEPAPEPNGELQGELVHELQGKQDDDPESEPGDEPEEDPDEEPEEEMQDEIDDEHTSDIHQVEYSAIPDFDDSPPQKETYNDSAENYHEGTENVRESTENYQYKEESYGYDGDNAQASYESDGEKPVYKDEDENEQQMISGHAIQPHISAESNIRAISEDDLTKSPSSSESEEEEVIQDGEVVYRTSDEEHTSEYRKDIPKYRDDFITGDEPGDIGDRLVLFEDYEHTHKSSKEEVTPGKLQSPFISGGLESSGHAQEREKVKFAEMADVRGRFESGYIGEPQHERAPRTITPPRDFEKTEYCNEDSERDPNIVRADDVVNEEEYMPKIGSSLRTMQRLKEASAQERDYRPKTSVRDEIETSVGKVEYENEPEKFKQWENKTEGGIYENEPNYNPDVVREKDPQNFEGELPEIGFTRNVLQHFKEIQSSDSYQVKGVRRELTPPLSGRVEFSNEPHGGIELYEGKPEAGIFESEPQIRDDVVHADEGEEIVIPEQGYARNVAQMFKQMSQSGDSSAPRRLKEFTPPREDTRKTLVESTPTQQEAIRESDQVEDAVPSQGTTRNIAMRFQQMQHDEPRRDLRVHVEFSTTGDSGIYENQPDVNQSVVHSDEPIEEQLPEQGLARNRLAQFRQMETASGGTRTVHSTQKEFTPPRDEPRIEQQRADVIRHRASSSGDFQQDEIQPESAGISENVPDVRSDVSREADTDWDEGLPTPDTTKNLVARFKNIQKSAEIQAQTPKPVIRKESLSVSFQIPPSSNPVKPSSAASSSKGASRFRVVQLEKCDACSKTVYIMERFEFNKCVYHKTCFKCSHCRRPLTPATYAVNENALYCMTHYKQMFKTKGNYDEGFGRTQYKKRWQSEPNLSSSSDEGVMSNHCR